VGVRARVCLQRQIFPPFPMNIADTPLLPTGNHGVKPFGSQVKHSHSFFGVGRSCTPICERTKQAHQNTINSRSTSSPKYVVAVAGAYTCLFCSYQRSPDGQHRAQHSVSQTTSNTPTIVMTTSISHDATPSSSSSSSSAQGGTPQWPHTLCSVQSG
jgi:hypothetical protein